jgi:hypothetical protein
VAHNADRANGIAVTAIAPVDDKYSAKTNADDPLGRGKHILDVLRG